MISFFWINKKKEHISKYIKEDLILINDYFNMENEFNKSFNDHFYISLISFKEYAKKNNKCIIGYFFEKKLKEKTMNLIRKILLQYFININKIESFNKISFLINEQDFSSFSLNNFEIFGILDILCNFEDNTFFDFENIIINIKYDNINDNLLEYFSTINFEKIFEKKIINIVHL